MTDGRKFTSNDIKTDPKTDLAIVRVEANEPLPFLGFGDSSQMEIGDRVLAVGAPFGLAGLGDARHHQRQGREPSAAGTTTSPDRRGHQSRQLGRSARQPGRRGRRHQLRDQEPLRRLPGRRPGDHEQHGPQRDAAAGDQRHRQAAYLGVEMAREVSPEVAARLGMKDGEGVVVARVVPNSPAAKAGIKADDVITSLDGQPIHDNRALAADGRQPADRQGGRGRSPARRPRREAVR